MNEPAQETAASGIAQAPTPPSAGKRRLMLLVGSACFIGSVYFIAQTFFPEILAEHFGNSSENPPPQVELNAKNGAPPLPGANGETAAASAESAGSDDSEESGDGDDAENAEGADSDEEADDAPLKFTDLVEGPETSDRVLDALDRMQSWQPTEGAYPESALHHYLLHKKLWVRMTAFAFAVETKSYEEAFLQSAGAEIRENYPRQQIHRFLIRLRSKNEENAARVSTLVGIR